MTNNNQRDYDQELIKSTRPQHELHDSPWVWYPIIALLVLWVLWMGWQGLQAIVI